jgi:RND family efflux transporter MFP subunit
MLNKIKKYGRNFVRFIRTPRGAIITGLSLVALGFLFSTTRVNPLATYDIGEVVKKDIVSIVDVTGRIKPADKVDLALERGGKVTHIDVEVGEDIQKGKLLLSAAGADLYASLAEAQSNLSIERLNLEEIVKTSQIDFSSAEESLIDEMENAYAKADNAVRNEADQLFYGSQDNKSFGAVVTTGGTETNFGANIDDLIDLRYQRKSILKDLDVWHAYLDDPDETNVKETADSIEGYLVSIQNFLNDIALIINSYYESSSSNTIVAGYRLDISTARTTISTALTNFRSAKQAYLTAEATSLSSSDNQLQGVLLQEQRVKNAEARVNAVYAEIEKSVIRAPFDGEVTKIDTEVGEIVPANTPIVSVMSNTKFEIETFIPETDIADIAINNTADVTLDAYDSDTIFGAYVSSVDPAETVIEGVATYKVLLQFNEEDERILSGMTANVNIVTNTSRGALSIPQRAVIEKNGQKFVRIVNGDRTEEIQVKTGLRGFNGDIEILEGLNEGDKIVVFTRN